MITSFDVAYSDSLGLSPAFALEQYSPQNWTWSRDIVLWLHTAL